jgi:hypothetical protein
MEANTSKMKECTTDDAVNSLSRLYECKQALSAMKAANFNLSAASVCCTNPANKIHVLTTADSPAQAK